MFPYRSSRTENICRKEFIVYVSMRRIFINVLGTMYIFTFVFYANYYATWLIFAHTLKMTITLLEIRNSVVHPCHYYFLHFAFNTLHKVTASGIIIPFVANYAQVVMLRFSK